MYLQNEKMAKLWVVVGFSDRFEQIYKTSLQNQTKRGTTKGRSHQEVFCEKGVLESFTKFTGKHLCWSLFFNKVAGLRPESLLKKRLQYRCFPLNLVKFFKNSFFKNTSAGCFCTKGLFLPIFCNEKSFKQIFFQLTGLTSSNISFYMTK